MYLELDNAFLPLMIVSKPAFDGRMTLVKKQASCESPAPACG